MGAFFDTLFLLVFGSSSSPPPQLSVLKSRVVEIVLCMFRGFTLPTFDKRVLIGDLQQPFCLLHALVNLHKYRVSDGGGPPASEAME